MGAAGMMSRASRSRSRCKSFRGAVQSEGAVEVGTQWHSTRQPGYLAMQRGANGGVCGFAWYFSVLADTKDDVERGEKRKKWINRIE